MIIAYKNLQITIRTFPLLVVLINLVFGLATYFFALENCVVIGLDNGPLTRYLKLLVAHAPGMPGTFSPPPISKETAG